MRREPRISQRDVVVDAPQRDAAVADAEEAHDDLKGIAGSPDRALDDPVGAQLAPAVELDRVGRRCLLDRPIGVARNHVELALEREIVPQNLRDELGRFDRFLVGRQRDEIRNGVVCGRTRFPADLDADFRLTRRRSLRRRCLSGYQCYRSRHRYAEQKMSN